MKSRHAVLLALVAVLVVGVMGCTSFKFSGAQVTAQLPAYTKVGDLDVTVAVNRFLGNSARFSLFNVSADAMDAPIYDAIQREIRKYSADAVVNITIEYKATLVNMIVNALTGFLWAPAEAHITGVIVKYNK